MANESPLQGAAAAFVAARASGTLATADATGAPFLVPVCYAWDGVDLWSAIDAKPKRSPDPWRLQRVRNILSQPTVALCVQDYLPDAWDQLAYVLVRGQARLVEPGAPGHAAAIDRLRGKYPQYQTMPLETSPAIAIRPTHVTSWGAVATRQERPATLATAITGRRSVRRFTAEPIARDTLERVLEAARWAPSPHGRQPWRFVVLTSAARQAHLAAAMGAEWEATLAQDGEPPAVVAQRLDVSRTRIRTAPALIIPCLYLRDLDHYPDPARQAAETTMAVQSLGAAIQNMLLTAYHAGLDMGWMCAPLFCPEVVQTALDLPPDWLPQALLPLGHAAADPKRRQRRPLDELVRWEE